MCPTFPSSSQPALGSVAMLEAFCSQTTLTRRGSSRCSRRAAHVGADGACDSKLHALMLLGVEIRVTAVHRVCISEEIISRLPVSADAALTACKNVAILHLQCSTLHQTLTMDAAAEKPEDDINAYVHQILNFSATFSAIYYRNHCVTCSQGTAVNSCRFCQEEHASMSASLRHFHTCVENSFSFSNAWIFRAILISTARSLFVFTFSILMQNFSGFDQLPQQS
jgi:hypothetical protein